MATPMPLQPAGPVAPDLLTPIAVRSAAALVPEDLLALGPLSKVYVIWLAGASCDGCSVAVTGGTHPRLEQLMTGAIPGVPRVELIHCLLSTESGAEWTANLFMAERGELDAPYIITWEGSVMDESTAGEGFWLGLGEDPVDGRQLTSRQWLDRLAPGAAAVVAIGTCAAWGGIPAASGNPTKAMGVADHLGAEFRSAFGIPVVKIPGCAPLGDNYTETVAALLLHLNGLAPLPELDEAGRPSWLFADTVHASCPRAGYYDEGVFATETGSGTCLVELGCWGPVVQCNIASRGVIDGHGGCMSVGGICIGCTMPGFPDRFAPFSEPPAFLADLTRRGETSRANGSFLRRMSDVGRRRRPVGADSARSSAVRVMAGGAPVAPTGVPVPPSTVSTGSPPASCTARAGRFYRRRATTGR